jgi:hypothetical protein
MINKLNYDLIRPTYHDIEISKPLPHDIAEYILLNKTCHVDHEGFDLNEIEQAYYAHNGVSLEHDTTWYKDGDATKGAHAIILPWFQQTKQSSLIIDHSQFVIRHPITGDAANQIKEYAKQRPELLRILSAEFKCGLDLCIDYIGEDRVYPVVHIEWDYRNISDMLSDIDYVEQTIHNANWDMLLPIITRFNYIAKNELDAFQQADFRSMLLFGRKSYKLIPTL